MGLTPRVEAHYVLMQFAEELGDTARALTHVRAIVAEAERAPPAERKATTQYVLTALQRLSRRMLLDSLARSTASYAAARRHLWERAHAGQPPSPDEAADPVGQPPPPIPADFWFRRGDPGSASGRARPGLVPGRVNLVVPAHQGCEGDECATLFAPLRALLQRFPELELTLMSRNVGAFAERTQPDPAREAELHRQWLHDWQQLPGALAVERERAFFRLPAPDGRVVYREPQ